MEYRLLVIAPTVSDLVANAGGYLFDQSMAGWRVMASVVRDEDTRALDILGVPVTDMQAGLVALGSVRSEGVVVTCAGMYDHDAAIRKRVGAVSDEVLVWDPSTACAAGDREVSHRLSHAARAFKGLALVAATGERADVGATESFRTAMPVRGRRRA